MPGPIDAVHNVIQHGLADVGDHFQPFYTQWAGSECGLLTAARWARKENESETLLEELRGNAFKQFQIRLGASHPLRARAKIIRAALSTAATKPERIVWLTEAIEEYEACWKFSFAEGLRRSTVGFDDPEKNRKHFAGLGVYERLGSAREIFADLALHHKWLHPGLLLAAETWAYIWDDSDLPGDPDVKTWILTVLSDGETAIGGELFELSLYRVPGCEGCSGAFCPHPLQSGYWRTGASRDAQGNEIDNFQHALQHAWWAEIGRDRANCNFDIYWQLRVAEDAGQDEAWGEREWALNAGISGRSGEAAIAAALRALSRRERLDEGVVVTAQYAYPCDSDPLLARKLAPVEGVGAKLLAPQFLPRVRVQRIHEVITHPDDSELAGERAKITRRGEKCRVIDGAFELIGVDDFERVYERMSLFPRITRRVKDALALKARDILLAERPYVPPPLALEVESAPGQAESWVDLPSKSLRSSFRQRGELLVPTAGEPDQRGLQQSTTVSRFNCILAESGMGKSLYLVLLQRCIANADNLLVPLRVGAGPSEPKHDVGGTPSGEGGFALPLLHAVTWDTTPVALLAIRDRLLAGFLPSKEFSDEDLHEWFLRLVRSGRVVWLLDAVDQISDPHNQHMPNLAAFLNSEHLRDCPVVITGRPESEATINRAFKLRSRRTLKLQEFDTKRIRRFLGGCSPQLLPTASDNRDATARKEGWSDLLRTPILLSLVRELALAPPAAGESLDHLKNRACIYRRAFDLLIDRGLAETLPSTTHYSALIRPDQIDALFEMTAAATMLQPAPNFSGALEGDFYREWIAQIEKQFGAGWVERLMAIQFFIMDSMFDKPEWRKSRAFNSLRWRHRSFCEYYAARHFLKLDRAGQQKLCATYARNRDWRWVFRFALSEAERQGKPELLTEIAEMLIMFGNPLVVWEVIRFDKVNFPDNKRIDVDRLVRWLVQAWHESSEAWPPRQDDSAPPRVTSRVREIIDSLFLPRYRDARWLHPAWELIKNDDPAKHIRDRFLGEFPSLCRTGDLDLTNEQLPADEEWPRTPDACHQRKNLAIGLRFDELRDQPDPEIGNRIEGGQYRRIPPDGDSHSFWMGSPERDKDRDDDEPKPHQVTFNCFWLRKFVTTNAEFELFDPGRRHEREQDNYSNLPEQPVVYVTWHEAVVFCIWLGNTDGMKYCLPTEVEWEGSCRGEAGRRKTYRKFWFGNKDADLPKHAWVGENSDDRTHHLQESIEAAKNGGGADHQNDFGLYDMAGNVWEWCADCYTNPYDPKQVENLPGADYGSFRVFRGGGFWFGAWSCRSANRSGYLPRSRNDRLGFRVALSPVQSNQGVE